ncbi:hypothetical protein [Streptomyces sp. NPDC018045]|uniref:hypothetical protein n=1 Tax=Streptomyces sp. NPDC018045 TaxID=3365037 RepID=UPI0037ADEF25
MSNADLPARIPLTVFFVEKAGVPPVAATAARLVAVFAARFPVVDRLIHRGGGRRGKGLGVRAGAEEAGIVARGAK